MKCRSLHLIGHDQNTPHEGRHPAGDTASTELLADLVHKDHEGGAH